MFQQDWEEMMVNEPERQKSIMHWAKHAMVFMTNSKLKRDHFDSSGSQQGADGNFYVRDTSLLEQWSE